MPLSRTGTICELASNRHSTRGVHTTSHGRGKHPRRGTFPLERHYVPNRTATPVPDRVRSRSLKPHPALRSRIMSTSNRIHLRLLLKQPSVLPQRPLLGVRRTLRAGFQCIARARLVLNLHHRNNMSILNIQYQVSDARSEPIAARRASLGRNPWCSRTTTRHTHSPRSMTTTTTMHLMATRPWNAAC